MRTTRKTAKHPLDHEPTAVVYARGQAGLTQTQLAEQCGVTKSLISEIEAGTRNATPAMINKLAEALNCPRVILERKREPKAEAAEATDVDVQLRDAERTESDDLSEVRR